jgi:hypothetical protein
MLCLLLYTGLVLAHPPIEAVRARKTDLIIAACEGPGVTDEPRQNTTANLCEIIHHSKGGGSYGGRAEQNPCFGAVTTTEAEKESPVRVNCGMS